MSDFNLRLLGKELVTKEFNDQLLSSRKNTEVIQVKDGDSPTTRTLNKFNLFDYNQAYQPKGADSDSLPIFSIENIYGAGTPQARPGSVAIGFLGTIQSACIEFSMSRYNSNSYCYCIVNIIGTDGTYEQYGDLDVDIYYDSSLKKVFINNINRCTCSVTLIKLTGEDSKINDCSVSSSSSGNSIKRTSLNGELQSGAFDEMISMDLISLDDSKPSLVIRDNSTNKFYVPTRSEIYGAINKTRTCTYDVYSSGASQYLNAGDWLIDESNIKVKDWDGDLILHLMGERSGALILRKNDIIKPGRLLTIINDSNVVVRYQWNQNDSNSRVPIESYMECYHYQLSTPSYPSLFYKNKVAYRSATPLLPAKYNGEITDFTVTVTEPKLPYIRPAGTNRILAVPHIANALSFASVYHGDYTYFGIVYDNGARYLHKIYTIEGGNTPDAPSIDDVTAVTSVYESKVALDLASTNWNSDTNQFNHFKFEEFGSGYIIGQKYFSLS